MKPLFGLWCDTWWLWIAFLAVTLVMAAIVGSFFLLLLPCLPIVFVYFAYARYDADGNEKPEIE
ncbi:MAG: hypothetical protein AAF958_06725 [Planctomycetota bacterium]